MNPEDLWVRDMETVLSESKEKYSIVEYSKVEGEQFLKFPEYGWNR